MSLLTTILGLFKYNTATDGNMTFNIDTAINEPFDKIDTAIGNIQNSMIKKDGSVVLTAEQKGVNATSANGLTTKQQVEALISAINLSNLATKTLSNINQTSALMNLGFLGNNFAENGYYKFPNGLVIQWGNVVTTTSTTGQTITFPIAFANACLSVISVIQAPTTTAAAGYYHYISGKYNTYFTTGYTASKYWIAIGY